jgi:hypothetical protein
LSAALPDIAALADRAQRERDAFAERIAGLPYERKGILFSEMLFLYLCALPFSPRRILESGRARAQSTVVLAKIFPQLPIISVEHDPASADVPVAAQRLAGFANVDVRFGDATRLLPRLAQPGDVALIDGPKGFRGLRLAFSLLATGRLPLVFVHDCGVRSSERAFLERHLPAALYSDHPAFARAAHVLDAPALPEIPPERRLEQTYPAAGYGYGLACVPLERRVSYGTLRWRAAIAAARERSGWCAVPR